MWIKGSGEEKVKDSHVHPSHGSLTTLHLTACCMIVHRQSVNGMGEKEGWGGKGVIVRGEGKIKEVRKEQIEQTM